MIPIGSRRTSRAKSPRRASRRRSTPRGRCSCPCRRLWRTSPKRRRGPRGGPARMRGSGAGRALDPKAFPSRSHRRTDADGKGDRLNARGPAAAATTQAGRTARPLAPGRSSGYSPKLPRDSGQSHASSVDAGARRSTDMRAYQQVRIAGDAQLHLGNTPSAGDSPRGPRGRVLREK